MRNRKITAAIAAVILVLLAAGGCGQKANTGNGNSVSEESSDNAADPADPAADVSGTEKSDAAAGTDGSADSAGAEESAAGEEEPESDGNTISILVPEEDASVMKALGDKYTAKSGSAGLTIRILSYDGYSDLSEILDETQADLFIFEQDRLTALVREGLLEPVTGRNAEVLRENTEEHAIEAATVRAGGDTADPADDASDDAGEKGNSEEAGEADDAGETGNTEETDAAGTIYARPLSIDNGAILYYDSSVIADPADLSLILADCESADRNFYLQLDSGWYQASFFAGAGCTLRFETDAEGNYSGCVCDYASAAGLDAFRMMLRTAESPSYVSMTDAGSASEIGALVGNVLDAPLLKEKLGDRYACAKLPKFTGDSGAEYQMSGYMSYQFLGERSGLPEEKRTEAEAVAEYLTSREAQLLMYRESGRIPAAREALRSELVQFNEEAAALTDQMQYDLPRLSAPSEFWNLATGFGDEIESGSLSSAEEDETLLAVLAQFQENCVQCAENAAENFVR